MRDSSYERNVFINCPFDRPFRELLHAAVFAVHDCGYLARSALEIQDASETRIEKIHRLIASCKFGIHDISRTELDNDTGLPRFNMPLELGLFLGAKRFGNSLQRKKNCLILDREAFRYQKFISDISGQDVLSHGGQPEEVIRLVRNWLSDAVPSTIVIPGGSAMVARYELFRSYLPIACSRLRLQPDELIFNNFIVLVEEWLRADAGPNEKK